MISKTDKTTNLAADVRCAVYTRKSTEDGLEQEFNSLDAQRDAGEAFIKSQTHEGWVCLPDHYDDGGFAGRKSCLQMATVVNSKASPEFVPVAAIVTATIPIGVNFVPKIWNGSARANWSRTDSS